jgi:flagellar protein FlaG
MMDIFSGVKNITQKAQNFDNITNQQTHLIKQVENSEKTSTQKLQDVNDEMDKNKLKKELQKIVEELNKALNPLNTTLKFKFNDKVDELTVSVIDTKSNKVIREYPPKEALELMEKMREIVGLLFDKKG